MSRTAVTLRFTPLATISGFSAEAAFASTSSRDSRTPPSETRSGSYRFLAWDKDVPVGYVDCGTFDRWTTWEGGPEGRGVVGVIDEPSGAIAYVTDPAQRRLGYGTEMIHALM